MESSDNEGCFDDCFEDAGHNINHDGLEFCDHCGEFVHRSTHWRHKQLTKNSDEEDIFGISMHTDHSDNELSDTLYTMHQITPVFVTWITVHTKTVVIPALLRNVYIHGRGNYL